MNGVNLVGVVNAVQFSNQGSVTTTNQNFSEALSVKADLQSTGQAQPVTFVYGDGTLAYLTLTKTDGQIMSFAPGMFPVSVIRNNTGIPVIHSQAHLQIVA